MGEDGVESTEGRGLESAEQEATPEQLVPPEGKWRRGTYKAQRNIRRATQRISNKYKRDVIKEHVLREESEERVRLIREGVAVLEKSGVAKALADLVRNEREREKTVQPKPDRPATYEFGYVREEKRMLPTGTIRWERKKVDTPVLRQSLGDKKVTITDTKMVSKAVRAVCLPDQTVKVEYSTFEENDDKYSHKGLGNKWRRTIWKELDEKNALGLDVYAKIALAMAHSNDVMFEEDEIEDVVLLPDTNETT